MTYCILLIIEYNIFMQKWQLCIKKQFLNVEKQFLILYYGQSLGKFIP